MESFSVPDTPADLDVAWLNQALAGADEFAGVTITDFSAEVVGEDRGFTGVVAAIQLEHASDATPRSLIAKFPLAERGVASIYRQAQGASQQPSRQMVERAAREVELYRATGGALPQLPRCYYAYADVETAQAVMLLEDLSGGEPGDALAGCSVEQARAVLAAIQPLHARWWQVDELATLAWPGTWASSNETRIAGYRERVEPVIAAFSGRLSQRQVEMLRSLATWLESGLDDLAAAPETLIHADLHLDNVFLMPERGAVLLDWQSPSRGPAAIDIAGFLVDSLSVADRRDHEIDLLGEYHRALQTAGVDGYSFDDLFDDYLRANCARLAGQIGWLYRTIDARPAGREAALVDAIFDPGRTFAVLLDHAVRLPG